MEGKNRNLLVCWFNFPFNSCKMVGKGFFLRGSFFSLNQGKFFFGEDYDECTHQEMILGRTVMNSHQEFFFGEDYDETIAQDVQHEIILASRSVDV